MLFRKLLPLLLLLLPVPAGAQNDPFEDGARDPLAASLVAEQKGIAPGKPFYAAVRIQHESPWHTYWVNPGGVGKATEVAWQLPEGFTAGPLVWPVPHVTTTLPELGPSHTYDGDLYIVTQITPPATLKAGDTVKLAASVSWLRCEDNGLCVEGTAKPEVSLPVAEAPEPDAASAAAIKAVLEAQPVTSAAWKVSLAASGDKWVVRAEPGEGANADPGKIHFFDAAQVISTDEQAWKKEGSAWVLEAGKQDEESKAEPGGFLYAANGWLAGGKVPAIIAGAAPAVASALAVSGAATGGAAVAGSVEEQIATIRGWGVRPLSAGDEAGDGKQGAGLTWPVALLFAFLGGMILNLMPCVFPVLGIKILGFVRQSGEDSASVKKHGLVYAAGVIASVLALTAVLLAVRAVGESAGWGFQLQNPVFLASLIILVFALSLGIAGVFELFPNLTGVGAELADKSGYKGSFFSGLLTVLLATPCTGPFMGPALGFALSADTSMALVIAIFTTLAVGLALPYVVLSWFPALVKKLPRPGAWMETFKQFMSFPMFATAVWLVTVFVGATGEGSLILILFALVLIAMALWLYGRFGNAAARPKSKRIALPLAVICTGTGLWMAVKAAHIEAPPATFSAETILERRAKGQITVVDFWAKWCLQCEANKAAAFDREAFVSALPKYDAALIIGDKTRPNPTVDKFLEAYKQGGIPYALVFPAKGPAIELPSVIASPQTLIDALEEAKRQSK